MKTNKLPAPKSNLQEVLLELIIKGNVSFFDFSYMQGFRMRMSELIIKYKLNINKSSLRAVNKFGNTYRYTLHQLPKSELKKAKEIYLSLFKK